MHIKLTHIDAAGVRRTLSIKGAASRDQAEAWAEQLYGVPMFCAVIVCHRGAAA